MDGSSRDSVFDRIKPHLLKVAKPARYLGGEEGSVAKDWESVKVRFALGFPDVYEVGMSYLGLMIVYDLVNRRHDALCERFFIPDSDFEGLLRREGIPLFSLESKTPLAKFDVVGFSLTYEMNYTNILLALDLAGIPLLSSERTDDHPLVIAGGGCTVAPEPVADFLDAMVIGEGEAVVDEIIAAVSSTKAEKRSARLAALARIDGVYVPWMYEPKYEGGRFAGLAPKAGAPCPIRKRSVPDIDKLLTPRLIVPFIDVPGGKATVEIMRGCPQGCRFCQAGFTMRPARTRSAKNVEDAVVAQIEQTGLSEASLLSLSSLDHPDIKTIAENLRARLDPARVSVGLPSLRADRMSAELAGILRRPRESSLTFAIEAGSQQLRDRINKRITEEDVLGSIDYALKAGWHKFKLYFMCGFESESNADVDGIVDLLDKLVALARAAGRPNATFHASLAVLIPKPWTPLQWNAMEQTDATMEKQARLRAKVKHLRTVHLNWHDPATAVVECALARGDRRVGAALLKAYEAGLVRQAENRNFRMGAWEKAFQDAGLDLGDYVFREIGEAEPLPWDHIDVGIEKDFLSTEREKFRNAETTESCFHSCANCGLGC